MPSLPLRSTSNPNGDLRANHLENLYFARKGNPVTTKDYLDYLDSPEFDPHVQFVYEYEPIGPTGIWKLIAWLIPPLWRREKRLVEYREIWIRGMSWGSKSRELLAKERKAIKADECILTLFDF